MYLFFYDYPLHCTFLPYLDFRFQLSVSNVRDFLIICLFLQKCKVANIQIVIKSSSPYEDYEKKKMIPGWKYSILKQSCFGKSDTTQAVNVQSC